MFCLFLLFFFDGVFMKFLNFYEIQFLFLDYFKKNNHKIYDGCSIIPQNDNSLLFTNSGMVQFKDFFLGYKAIRHKNITTSQSCIRAGGKHNDLSNVGYTSRHHTLFEMLGNFSFGGYFKNEAIFYAWFFLTHILFILKDKLFFTIYENDFESESIWFENVKINKKNLIKLGKKDNFWMMGNNGPCGPCTEIFYDHGDFLNGNFDINCNFGDRYIEIWNLVFMEYNFFDLKMEKLLIFCVDTGMGLERISAVMQGVSNNYNIDIFKDLKNLIIKNFSYHTNFINDSFSLNVISDHLRSASIMIFYGILPSNDGRSYVLRKIIRRAIIHGKKINIFDSFLYKLFKEMVYNLEYYNYLLKDIFRIEKIFLEEEVKFDETLNYGLKKLNEIIFFEKKKICGKDAFILYDTYGFPIDLTVEISKEYNLEVDVEDFYKHMLLQKNSNDFNKFYVINNVFNVKNTNFIGYNFINYVSKIQQIIVDNKFINVLKNYCKCILILDNSPFYFESGGQIGDKGFLIGNNFIFFVENVKNVNGFYIHYGFLKFGYIIIGDYIKSCVDFNFRKRCSINHSSTHIINYVLKVILSENVKQLGSYIDDCKLRFDFLYNYSLNIDIVNKIEFLINQYILNNLFVHYDYINFFDAKKKKISYLENDIYSDKVRVVYIGKNFSSELCAGTHVKSTGDIGLLKILSLSGVSSGVKRIEAVTAFSSLFVIQQKFYLIDSVKFLFKCDDLLLLNCVDNLILKNLFLFKKINKLKKDIILNIEKNLFNNIILYKNINFLIFQFITGNNILLKKLIDNYKNFYVNGIVILFIIEDNMLNICFGITDNLKFIFNADLLIKYFFIKIRGFGGGNHLYSSGGMKKFNDFIDINIILNNYFEFLKRCVL